jgi:hypothetical protein
VQNVNLNDEAEEGSTNANAGGKLRVFQIPIPRIGPGGGLN